MSLNTMLFLHCLVRISSSLDLQSVAALISGRIFGGMRFVPTSEFDEVPGVRLEADLLMLSIRICGESPHFGLHIDTHLPIYAEDEFPKLEIVNIAAYIEEALKGIEQVQIIPT